MAADVPVVTTGRPIDTNTQTTMNVDFSSDLTLDHESEAPLLTLLNKLKDETVLTHEFKFAIGRFVPRTATISAGTAAGSVAAAVNITLSDFGEYFLPGDVVEVASDHDDATHTSQLIVTEVSGDVLTVKGYDPATYGVAQTDTSDTIRVIGSGMKEGSNGRGSRQTVPTVYTNYTTSFEDYFDVTRLADADRQYTGPERSRLREEVRKKHAVDGEYSLHLSKKIKDVTSGGTGGGATNKPRYQMDGLLPQISTVNSLTYGAALADTELYAFMTTIHNPMYSGGMKRMVLASGQLMSEVNLMASAAIRITTRETTWGPNITEVQFAGKTWQFIEAPALSDARSGYGEVIHPAYLKKRTLKSTVYEMNVQNNIDKFIKDGFYSVFSLECRLAEIMGVIKPS